MFTHGAEKRVAVAWVDGVLRGGLMVISVYLWHSEGLSDRNMSVLHAAGDAIAKFGGPWLMGGDFNMTPAELQRAHAWLKQIGGQIRAPELPTCRSATGGRVIDFCIIDTRIAGAIESVATDLDFPASPHQAVVIRLRCKATRDMAWLLIRPNPFPSERSIGCVPRPAVPDEAGFDSLGKPCRAN